MGGAVGVMISLRRLLVVVTIIAASMLVLFAGTGTSSAASLIQASSSYSCPPYSCTTVFLLDDTFSPANGAVEPTSTLITLSVTYTSGGTPVPGLLISHFAVLGVNLLSCTNLKTDATGTVTCPYTTPSIHRTVTWYAQAVDGPITFTDYWYFYT